MRRPSVLPSIVLALFLLISSLGCHQGERSGIDRSARVIYASSVDIKAGETKSVDVTLETRGDGPGEFSGLIFRTDREYGNEPLTMPNEMEVDIQPVKIMAYPNNTYHLTITLETYDGLAAGEYWLRFEHNFENVFRGSGWIRVTVR